MEEDQKIRNEQLALIDMWDGAGRQTNSTYIKISQAPGHNGDLS